MHCSIQDCWQCLTQNANEANGVTVVTKGHTLLMSQQEKTCTLRLLDSTLHIFCGGQSYALPQRFWREDRLRETILTCVAQLQSNETMSPREAYVTLVERLGPFHSHQENQVVVVGRTEFRYYLPDGTYTSTWLTFRERRNGCSMLLVRTRLQECYILDGMVDRMMVDVIACYVVSPMDLDLSQQEWAWPHHAGSVVERLMRILRRASDVLHRASDVLHRASDVLHRASDVLHRASDVEHTLRRVQLEHRQASDNQEEAIVAHVGSGAQVFIAQQPNDDVLWCWKEDDASSAFLVPDTIALLWTVMPFILSISHGY